jgi:hypothetical protein
MGSNSERVYRRDDDYNDGRSQRETDKSHLKTLSLIYYILAALNCLSVVLLVLVCVGMGVAIMFGSFTYTSTNSSGKTTTIDGSIGGNGPPVWAIGLIPIGIGVVSGLFLAVWTYLVYLTGRNLGAYRRPTFCFVMAILMCVTGGIIGIILGIFTIMVLNRPTVQELFARNA